MLEFSDEGAKQELQGNVIMDKMEQQVFNKPVEASRETLRERV